jgi:two-component system phosphate regulon sensor histidine kinase PhoR
MYWVAVGITAVVVWLAVGPAGGLGVLCLALVLLVRGDRENRDTFMRWLRSPRSDSVPDDAGAWNDAYAAVHRLKRDLEEQVRTHDRELSRLKGAINAVPDGLVILGDGDRIEWCNPLGEEHFGIDRAHAYGQPISALVRSVPLVDYLGSGAPREPLVIRLERIAGQARTLAITVVAFGDKDRLLASRDITRLDVLETTRRDFVANVSHELRTPLTVVLGFLETMKEMKDLPQRAIRPVQLASSQAVRMQQLVEELLELSRLESANPTSEERVDVPALMSALQQEALALSAGRHHVSMSVGSNASILGSADELRSAFGNLVTNAVRYTPVGGSITLSWEVSQGGGRFCVTDTGIGIEPQHIPRITERFYRVDRSRSRETGGTGLGLAIVKHVASRHEAQLSIESSVGAGSRFAVTFPLSRVANTAETPTTALP